MSAAEGLAFSRALARAPARSVVNGLRAVDQGAPSFDGVAREHAAYVRALEAAGVAVEVLPALEAFPDSLFVEDTALVFGDVAIALRPGAPSRFGETAAISPALEGRFAKVLNLDEGFVDGGDILTTPSGVYIGRSARTTVEGALALVALLSKVDRRGVIVPTPEDVLHLKSDCALLDEETVLATARLAASGAFDDFRVLITPEGEEGAANALRINDRVLVSDAYPRTAELLANSGYRLAPLATREIAKIDAGLSCMSLRWMG